MNFVKPDGTPAMPELEWYGAETPDPNSIARVTGLTGYEYFWILAGTIIVATILLYMYAGLIPIPKVNFTQWKCCQRKAIKGKLYEKSKEQAEDDEVIKVEIK
jgi:hypothetical protein